MTKVFEDFFSEIQANIVSVCLDYVDDKADEIFIYCSYEPKMYFFDVFYKIHGEIVHKHNLNQVVDNTNNNHLYDVSRENQRCLLKAGNESFKILHKKCLEFNREMPTEMKLHFNVKHHKLQGKYSYELVYSDDSELLPDHIFELWYDEMKAKNKN